MHFLNLLVPFFCVFAQALHLERKERWLHFQLPKGQVNCAEALFSLHPLFIGKSKDNFSIQDDSELECCKLSLSTSFSFKSAALTKNIEVNLLDEIHSVRKEFEESTLICSPLSGKEIPHDTAFVELLPLEYFELKSFASIFACSKSILYNRLGNYGEFLHNLMQKQNCHLVLKNSQTGMEPLSDALPIGEILSTGEFEFIATYTVHFVNSKGEIFLIRHFSKPTSDEAHAYEEEFNMLKLIVYSEFSCIIPDINQIQVYLQTAKGNVFVVKFPPVFIPIVISSKEKILHSLLFDPFEDVKGLREQNQMQISPWICSSLLLGKQDLYQPSHKRHVKERTLIEKLFFHSRSFVSSEYVKDCLWEFLEDIQEVVHLEATVLFPIEVLDGTIAFYDISIPLSTIEAEHSSKAQSSVVIIPPYQSLRQTAVPVGMSYNIVKVQIAIPWKSGNFMRFEVDLIDEIPFFSQVLQILIEISHDSSFNFNETGFFPLNLEDFNEVIYTFSSALSVAHLQNPDEMPVFCQQFPNSLLCQNVLFLENEKQKKGIYLMWGFPKMLKNESKNSFISHSNVHIQMSKFSIFNVNSPTSMQIAILISPLPAAKIAYFHSIKNWDPTRKYDHHFENIDWLVEFVSRHAPSQLFGHISYKRLQSLLAASIAFAFELLGELVGKWEYSIITSCIIEPYFSKFIAFAQANSNSSASFIISLLLKVWRWSSTSRYLLIASPYVAKYLEIPVLSSTLNSLLNSFSELKQIPLAFAKRILFHSLQRHLNHPQEHSIVIIFDPKTFDSRLIPWKKPQNPSSIPATLTFWNFISRLDIRPIFFTFWSFGFKKYISLRASQEILKRAKEFFFQPPRTTIDTTSSTAAINNDYSESTDSILLARIAQKCNLEPTLMSTFELSLASALKKLLNSSFDLATYTTPYMARIISLYLARWLGNRTLFLLNCKQQEIEKEIAPIHEQVAKLTFSVEIIDQAMEKAKKLRQEAKNDLLQQKQENASNRAL
jgi:hypothetical protein